MYPQNPENSPNPGWPGQPPNTQMPSNPQWPPQPAPYGPGQYPQQTMPPGYPQPYPGQVQRPPQPPKKPMSGWQIMLIIAVIIFGIPAGINGAIQAMNEQSAKTQLTATAAAAPTSKPTEKPQPTPTPKPEDKIYKLGEYMTVKDGEIEWMIGGSSAEVKPGPVTELDEAGFHEYSAKAGNMFLVVKLSMQNRGEKSQEVNNAMWELQSKDGQSFPSLSDVSYQDVASVFPAKRLDAELLYEIPAGQKAFRLLFRLKEGSKPIVWEFAI